MASTVETPHASALEQKWWLRAPAVLFAPRQVFVALRDDSDDAVDERGQWLGAMIVLAGMAAVLATPTARGLLNGEQLGSWSLIPIWVFFGGGFYGIATYWLGGGLLFGAARRLDGLGSYRRARHLLALATAPMALTLFTLWPLRIAIYGEWLFRWGGNDYGTTDYIFGALVYASFVWSAVLLVLGVRTVHGWSWGRSLATVALAASLPVLIVLASHPGWFSH